MGLERIQTSANRFGGYLRQLRERRRLSLEAAENLSSHLEARLTSSYLSRLESGLTVPNLAKLSTISHVYDIPLTTLVERYEVEQRGRARIESEPPRSFDELVVLLRRKLRSGAYLEALQLAVAAGDRLECDADLADAYGVDGARYLKLVECQAMVHLELYESAKHETERILELDELRTDHRLAAWQFFIACCTKLERYNLALAALELAEREAELPAAPARMKPDLILLRGNLHVLTRQWARAVESYGAALRLYRAQRNQLESCRTRIHLGGALTELGKLVSAGRYLARALEQAEQGGFEQLRAIGLCNLAAVAYRKGDYPRAESCAYRAGDVARRLGLHAIQFKSHYYLMRTAEALDDEPTAKAYRRMLADRVEQRLPPSPELDRFLERLTDLDRGESS